MVLQHHDTLIEEGGDSLEVPRSFLPAIQKDNVRVQNVNFSLSTAKLNTNIRIKRRALLPYLHI
jgi:hypothetical protein